MDDGGGNGDRVEPRDWLKSSLALLSMIGFLGTIYLLSVHEIKEGARDIIMVLTGVIIVIILSWFSYKYIEIPFNNLRHKIKV